ncbi:MAG: CbiX/SirB N-terminal domain-containing protein [Deltaproteobacteria bacterium]|nr:CbiX/SirB N-terminal domain-containing protein [Deltaproteobacteria bacterium]
MTSVALILLAHGSRLAEANDATLALAAEVRSQCRFERVEAAFLEHGLPTLSEAIDGCVRSGAERILIFPHFLTPGVHLRRDLPEAVAEARRCHPHTPILVTPALFDSSGLPQAILQLVGGEKG